MGLFSTKADIKLYGFSVSPNCRKALVALEHKGLKYELVNTFPGADTPEFRAISPLGLIPGMEDGKFKISDSSVILEYLEQRYPKQPLLPSKPEDQARARWLSVYGGDKLFPLTWILVNDRTKDEYRTGAPEASLVEQTRNETFPAALDYVETQLPRRGMFFDKFSVADIGIAAHLMSAKYAGFVIDPDRFPKLSAYMERIQTETAFSKTAEIEKDLVALVMKDD